MIILNEPIPQDKILFKSTINPEDESIIGAEWWSSEEPDRLKIEFVDIIGRNQNFKSDITESNYTIYKNKEGEDIALHI